LNKALGLGADYIATGHYARLEYSSTYGRYTVQRAQDSKKDQTYVLYGLTQEQIARTLMPLGEFKKEQVRKMAGDLGLSVAAKAESQEICFVVDDNYRNFLREKTMDIQPGPFLNMNGEVIGRHQGIPFYTIGQRRGLGLAGGQRLYVVNIDQEHNTITVGPEEAILDNDLIASDLNLVLYSELMEKLDVEAQVRYNGSPSPAVIKPLEDGRLHVHFKNPQRSITPGQAVVFYQGDYLVGGATIERAGLDLASQ
jgi:tRNA-specific 2-thiouridylase